MTFIDDGMINPKGASPAIVGRSRGVNDLENLVGGSPWSETTP